MTIKEALVLASNQIGHIESTILLEYILKVDRQYLIVNNNKSITKSQETKLKRAISKIKSGEPLQYITSKANFMGIEFYVDKRVLIPQPDTEILVQEALKVINNANNEVVQGVIESDKNCKEEIENKEEGKEEIENKEICKEKIENKENRNEKTENKKNSKEELNKKIKVLDLCTGSGCIAISLAKYAKNVEIYASDISKKALNVAQINYNNIRNVEHDMATIKFIKSDMFNNLQSKENEKLQFDVIVSNPPYIKSAEISTLDLDVQNEPHIALNGGENGLKFYYEIRKHIEEYLKENGTLLMEIGYDQKEEVQKIFENSKCVKDLAGHDRVIIWERN